jgi:hypothetical protein
MKKIFSIVICLSVITFSAMAQEDSVVKKSTFNKENLFVGGAATGGFGNGSFAVGLGPHFGYSFNKYIDVAIALNYNYVSQRDIIYLGDKVRQSVIGPGIFTRLFPVNFLFVQAQYERNFTMQKYIAPSSSRFLDEKITLSADSYLLGAGYCQGRQNGGNSYYYFSIMFDVGKDINSPYIDQLGRKDPILRAGFNFALFGGDFSREGRRNRRSRGDD